VVVSVLLLAVPSTAHAEPSFHSLSEGTPVPSMWEARQQVKPLQALHCKSGKPQQMLTLRQALKSARAFAVKRVGAQAVASLEKHADTKGADRAAQTAAGAALAGAPLASLVALLDAHAQAPKSPDHLANAAGVLNTFGKGREAVALAKAAQRKSRAPHSTMGFDGKAMLLNNLGQGLSLMKRYPAAEKTLRTAVSREPELSEAKTNLAVALACEGQAKPAARFIRQAQNRQPHTWVGTEEPPTGEPDEVSDTMPAESVRPLVLEVFDMTGGVDGMFPHIRYPATWQEMTQAKSGEWQALIDEENQRMQFYIGKQQELTAQINWGALSPAKRNRLDLVREYIATANREPDIRALLEHTYEPVEAVGEALLDYQEEAIAAAEAEATCQDQGAIAQKGYATWKAAMHNLDKVLRDHYQAEYRYTTALIANIEDPLLHELLMAELNTVRPWYSLLLAAAIDWTLFQMGCEDAPLAEQLKADEGTAETPERCAQFLRGVKFAIKLGRWFELSSNCESLSGELGVGAGWIGAFVEASNNFATDELTVALGPKQSLDFGAGEVSAKEGVYVTVSDRNGLVDAGVKVETGGSLGLVGVSSVQMSGPGVTVSFVSGAVTFQ
jgi:tetratricopeptide (TPR) repeat protein